MLLRASLVLSLVAGLSSVARAQQFTTIDYPGSVFTVAQGINNSGQIVGYYGDASGNVHGFLDNGGVFSSIDVNLPSGYDTAALGINNNLQIVGVYHTSYYTTHGFLDNNGTFSTIDFPGAVDTGASGINDSEQIVGNYDYNPVGAHRYGFLDNGGNFSTIDVPSAPYYTATWEINDSGQIVGGYYDASNVLHGFLDSGGNFSSIDFPGATGTWANGINIGGQIVGYYIGSGVYHGFLYKGGSFSAIDVPSATLTAAYGINDGGDIVGDYTDASGRTHGFLYTPACPVNPKDVILNLGGLSLDLNPIGMFASFTPSSGATLAELASSCGFTGFDWVQTIDQWPGPSGLYAESAPSVPIIIPPQSPINDPPLGGYTYLQSQQPPLLGAYPFYYNPVSIPSGCANRLRDGTCSEYIVSNLGFTLNFLDGPVNACLPGGAWWIIQYFACQGSSSGSQYMAFTTQLVGICNATPSPLCSGMGKPSAPLFQWTWNDNFNGTSGGVSGVETASVSLPDSGSGTGGVTVTNINGTQLPPVVPPSEVATTASGLAYSRVTQTFNGTVTIQNISGSPISGPFQIFFFGLTPGVTLADATKTLSGTPYLTVPGIASLTPGQKATVAVQFKDPSKAPINFTPVIYSGSMN